MLINNIDLIKKQLLQAVENAMEEIGVTGVAELQSNSPVKEGILKRSITFKKAKSSYKYTVTYGSAIDYAPYTEFRNKSKGWMRTTMNSFSSDAMQILTKHLGKVGK